MLVSQINAWLDAFVRPRMHIAGRSVSSFHVCGLTGVGAAAALAMALVIHRGESGWVMFAIVLAAILTFFTLVMGQKLVTGEEHIIYYHHEIGVMLVAAALVRILDQPPLLYLDATLLGIGAFLACGRVGCLMVGCCHGRPHRFGMVYRPEHAADGFTPYYVGIRLFPIQAVEAVWVLLATASGAWMVWRGAAPGAALAWYVVLYDTGRFCFELVRGDADRPYYAGFSQAQWISAILLLAVVAAEWRGILPWRAWHAAVAAALVVTMLALAAAGAVKRSERGLLLHPHHVHEVAAALEEIASRSGDPNVHVVSTSRVRISGGAAHFSFSCRGRPISADAAETLAALVRQLRHITEPTELVRGGHDVYHLIVQRDAGRA